MKIVIALIALIASSTATRLNSSALNGCVKVNAALAAQVADISELTSQLGDTVSDACRTLDQLSNNLDDVIAGTTNDVVDLAGGLLGGLGLGAVTNLLGGVVNTVNSLLSQVLGLVNSLVGNLVSQTCNLAANTVSSINLNQADLQSLANVNVCFNPNNLMLINTVTGAVVQLTMQQAQALVNLVNALANQVNNTNIQARINAGF